MKRFILVLPALMVVILFAVISQSYAAEYKGRIVDADTGEPIEGVVFIMRWQQWCMPGYDKFFDAGETLTDKEGFFRVEGPSLNFSLICWSEDIPFFIAYKAGYIPVYNSSWYRPNLMYKGFYHGGKVVIKLRKATSMEEMINAATHAHGGFPNRFQKRLIKEINKELRRFNLETYPEVEE